MIAAEIIAIGNELLLGDVLDTNANWLCKQITGVGGSVQRVVQVRDDRLAIVRELQSALSRSPALIFTTGGLGPTADDMTLEAVAEAVHCPLAQQPEALAMVRNTFADLAQRGYVDDAQMTPERAKMANLPHGSIPLQNMVGAAPGVALRLESTTVICLPGVPKELRAIYEGPLQPLVKPLFGNRAYMQQLVIAHCKDKSVLAPILKAVADRHPNVYVKSRAREYGSDVTFRVTLSAAGNSQEEVDQQLATALDDVCRSLAQAQISTVIEE